MIKRKLKKQVTVGGIPIGGESKITVQSMLNIPADQIEKAWSRPLPWKTLAVISLESPFPKEAVKLVYALKSALTIPVVADIHFDYRLALESAEAGVDKIRINPGNIGDESKVKAVADTCRQKGIPIRIGVNSALEGNFSEIRPSHAGGLRDSALYHASLLENMILPILSFSMKSSHVPTMVKAYELTSQACDYPLHLGVTEAGTERMGMIKIIRRDRRFAAGGHWRYHTGIPDRGPGEGDLRGKKTC